MVELNFEDKPFGIGVAPPAHRNKLDTVSNRIWSLANERHLDFQRNVSIAAKKVLLALRAGIEPVANAQDLHHNAVAAIVELV